MKKSSKERPSVLIARIFLLAFMADPASPASAQGPVELTFQAQPTGAPLERRLLIVLRDNSKPVTDATVEVNVDMPSMPLMHRVPKATATPGETPGEYVAKVTLDMPGEWAARIVVDKPRRTTVVQKFQVD